MRKLYNLISVLASLFLAGCVVGAGYDYGVVPNVGYGVPYYGSAPLYVMPWSGRTYYRQQRFYQVPGGRLPPQVVQPWGYHPMPAPVYRAPPRPPPPRQCFSRGGPC